MNSASLKSFVNFASLQSSVNTASHKSVAKSATPMSQSACMRSVGDTAPDTVPMVSA